MFNNLSEKLSRTFRKISGRGRLTESNIQDTLREVRIALLEADVAFPVVRNLIDRVKESALGQEINKCLTPGQKFIKIMYTELVSVMGDERSILDLTMRKPTAILIVGQQGVGKTTTVGKLGYYLYKNKKKKVLAVSADVYRPAAIKQLEILAMKSGIDFFPSNITQKPLDAVTQAINQARLKLYDVLLIDTAGRLHIDKPMMQEIIDIQNSINPSETLFVVDAMTGQDAANSAKIFNQTLPLTGIILTKADSDARCGAALSIRYITGKPIKFLGIGEKNNALEPFYPDRLAKRILGMNDVLSFVEDIESKIDIAQAKQLAIKLKKGNDFNLNDFLDQLKQMRNIGGMASIINKLANFNQLPKNIKLQMDNKVLIHMEAIINSMTAQERINKNIIKGSHKRRIAAGSGMQVQDVNRLLKQFDDMQRIMKTMQKSNMGKIARNIKGLMPFKKHSNIHHPKS